MSPQVDPSASPPESRVNRFFELHLEVPTFASNAPFYAIKGPDLFFSRAADHAVVLSLTVFWMTCASFVSPLLITPAKNPFFWPLVFSVLFLGSFFYRFFFECLLGRTLGAALFHLRPRHSFHDAKAPFFFRLLFESLELGFPVLWLLELLLASHCTATALSYRKSYEHHSLLE